MSIFSLARNNRLGVKSLPGGLANAFVADEDGTVLLDQNYPSYEAALDAAVGLQKSLRALRVKHLGVLSLELTREDYRKAKAAADVIRDQFVAAKEAMASEAYRAARQDLLK